MLFDRSTRPSKAGLVEPDRWQSPACRPEPYDLLMLRLEDGSMRRGTWTGKIWWGYDPRVRRSRELLPVAWRPWE